MTALGSPGGGPPVQHTIVTFIAPVAPDRLRQLEVVLAEIQPNPVGNPLVPFGSIGRLHFASLVILPEDGACPPYLVFENNFDGPLDTYLDDLLLKGGPGLHRIFGHCVGYAGAEPWDAQMLREYLVSHVVWPNAYHLGTPGRSQERIRREAALVEQLQTFLDGLVQSTDAQAPAATLRERIQGFASERAPWVASVGPRLSQIDIYLPWAKIAAAVLAVVLFWPVVVPLGLLWLLVLVYQESSDEVQPTPPPHEHVQRLLDREDRTHIVQNHMASVSHVKPGLFRWATLWGVLSLVNLVARTATRGELSGIPSIHFAHWSLIDRGERLLFLTNYDGSWENYLDDFIDKASAGLSAIWSNTQGFPKSYFLGILCGGSRDGTRFKAIARDKQVYSNVWYSAYPALTVQRIDKHSSIVEDMYRPLDDAGVRGWLWRF